MPSVLNVDTIADKAGTGPVVLTKQEAAKAWHRGNSTGTSLLDSLNVSTLGDTNTGTQTVNLTSSMSSVNYQASSCIMENNTLLPRIYNAATGSYVSGVRNTSASLTDAAQATAIHGDLA